VICIKTANDTETAVEQNSCYIFMEFGKLQQKTLK